MSTLKLYGITYSPWTYKARWALSWNALEYAYQEYLIMLSKAALRLRLNRWSEPITVPLAVVDGQILKNSLEIAQYADGQGEGDPLQTESGAVRHWDMVANECMELGRFRMTHSYATDPTALKAAVPPAFRGLPGALLMGKFGLRYMRKTYPMALEPHEVNAQIAIRLRTLRQALNGQEYILSEPSYADMTMATTLQIVDPVDIDLIPMESVARPHWRSDELHEEFNDLCQWRDHIFATMKAPRIGI